MNRWILLLFFCGFTETLSAQSQEAKEWFDKGLKSYTARKTDEAATAFLKATEKDSTYADAWFKLGQINEVARKEALALQYYTKAIHFKPDDPAFRQAHTYIGTRALRTGDYEKARPLFEFALKNTPPGSLIIKQLSRQLETCQFALAAKSKKINIKTADMGNVVNFSSNQYFPVLTADNETLIFTARSESGDENLYFSTLANNQWSNPQSISARINTAANEGTCSISADGRTLVFTSCDARDSFGSCDLYISRKTGNDWSTPENMGMSINTREWESQPSLSNDGTVLFFSSRRHGGFGEKDIWMSEFQNNQWTPAVNLGGLVNTARDEVSPFIHANGHTLFFASDGHIGMGGFDLYLTERKANGFTIPENLGYPLNNHLDQAALFIASDGKKGYYSTDNQRSTRLIEFEIPDELSRKFSRVNYVKGLVQDATTGKTLDADIELIDLKTNSLVTRLKADKQTGDFTAVLPNGSHFGLFVSRQGYFSKSLSFDFSEKTEADGKQITVMLVPVRKEVNIVLNNLFFDSGKATLKPESFAELNKLLQLLQQNAGLMVEISGHTDNIGKDTDNQALSEKRAMAVVAYLTAQGVAATRLKAVGYGEAQPLMPNDTDENRRQNRRIEMKIL
ncbi:OmpA family protein [Emticicia sp. 21SJ11W-3]|uniref:OmpA family protein n=1 Tax=Emticicia sp. 21SJ11W-3 TaxID=2916755 RepID=UPI00209D1DEC|nr:OmpA family protein [Emticicia sp. 21SJ11W-3]UTA66304.1 OmpA family protein [Emticicia sp. 21SJ11W-3]